MYGPRWGRRTRPHSAEPRSPGTASMARSRSPGSRRRTGFRSARPSSKPCCKVRLPVSAVPPSIGGLGSTQLKLRASPAFDPMKARVLPEEYFLFSRFDGSSTLRDVLLESGLPLARAIQIVMKLRSLGALLLPTESTAPASSSAPTKKLPLRTPDATEKIPVRTASGSQPPTLDTTLPDPTGEELTALSETHALSAA